MRRLTGQHAQLWQSVHLSIGSGAVYQGRYKAIPVQTGSYFYNVCRYVERNPLRANLVVRVEDWPWSSCWRRLHGEGGELLDPWPVACPANWLSILNVEADGEDAVRKAIERGNRSATPNGRNAGLLLLVWRAISGHAGGLGFIPMKNAPDPFLRGPELQPC